MKYLAIDTAGSALEILVKNGEKSYFWRDPDFKKTSEILLVKIDEMLDEAKLTLKDLDYLACITGPGSFTGIRIGVTTIKTFASVSGTKVIAVNSLEKLSYNKTRRAIESIVSVINAYADNCYLAVYSSEGETLFSPVSMTYEEAKKFISLVTEPSVIFADEKSSEMLKGTKRDDGKISLERAVERAIELGKAQDYRAVEPFYLLKSQAERDKESKEKANAN